jgi:hypothetical protein
MIGGKPPGKVTLSFVLTWALTPNMVLQPVVEREAE